MKRNTYYLSIAIVAFIEVLIFGWAIETGDPFPSVIALLTGIGALYIGKSYVDEVIEDERTRKINEITALRTLQITWIALFLYAIWVIIEAFGEGIAAYNRRVGALGIRLLFVLCSIILLYVILSLYYDKKYGA